MIYILRAVIGKEKFLKIGFTESDVQSRIRKLQTGCPVPIELMATIPGSMSDEKRIHIALWSFRASGEWFRLRAESIAALSVFGIELPQDKIPVPKGKASVKAYLNFYFKDRYYPDHVRPRRLSEFCEHMGYDQAEVESLASNRVNFCIMETTPGHIYEKLGYLIDDEPKDVIDKFIFPNNIVNMHTIANVIRGVEDTLRRAESK